MKNHLFSPADILLPNTPEMQKWSVIACDQYTSQPEYWDAVKSFVADAPSTLEMIFPEVYLGQDDARRITEINAAMERRLVDNTFRTCPDSFVLVERTMQNGTIRRGLVGKLDLEAYSFSADSGSPIRPTEGTVESRLPARVKIRQNAPLELPHVLVLIDDLQDTVLGQAAAAQSETVYDFDLFQGTHIKGSLICGDATAPILDALDQLLAPLNAPGQVAIAVGDGNHSLATAKACFEALKTTMPESQWSVHPARYALVELMNLHQDALQFEPVHRVVFDTNPTELLDMVTAAFPIFDEPLFLSCIVEGKKMTLPLGLAPDALPVGPLQAVLDFYLKNHAGEIDYIHDDDALRTLASRPGAVGFLLPPMEKSALLPTVQKEGALPRKTFSLGCSSEKRFYLEARRITL